MAARASFMIARDQNIARFIFKEGPYHVVADDGHGHMVEIEFIKGNHAQELGIVF